MKCIICEEDVEKEHFSSYVNTKHDGTINLWRYKIAMQKRLLEQIEHNVEKSQSYRLVCDIM
jgi:hypothetical protein